MSIKLIDAITKGNISLSQLSKEELTELGHTSVANGDFRALHIAINQYTGLYDYDDHKPYWLISDFDASCWSIEINIGEGKSPNKLTLDWQSVILDDGKRLTDPCHTPLLLAFKYWVTATSNPRYNGGKLVKGNTVYRKICNIRTLINVFLLHSGTLELSKRHLSALSQSFLLDIFTHLVKAGGIENGIYRHTERVAALLRQHITNISDLEADRFSEQYPYITRHLTKDEQSLGLSVNERIKACCWLHSVDFYLYVYQKKNGDVKKDFNAQGNQSTLFPFLYESNILHYDMSFTPIEELKLKSDNYHTEYRAIPNKDNSKGLGESRLKTLSQTLSLLHTLHDKEVSHCHVLEGLNIMRIQQHVKTKALGRYTTLPVRMVFDLVRQTYEFTHKYQDAILNSVQSVLSEAQTKSCKGFSNPNYLQKGKKGYSPDVSSSERGEWLRTQTQNLIAPELTDLGIQTDNRTNYSEDVFPLRRQSPTLFDLYNVLQGNIQVLTGVIMAKRQDELVSLKSHGNIEPNIDPASSEGENSEYWLKAKLKKSGNGGKNEKNTTIKRPIPRAFALLIWKLEQFNQAITKLKCNKNTLSLFNPINVMNMTIGRCNAKTYNKHLDAMSDYFETSLVDFGKNDIRRYYVRQHQLRRFFAMVFFWSKGFDGLDSLRWMLGHTDMEHLHHYITESESGKVLNGVKATYLRNAMDSNNLENIDRLRQLIAKRYNVNTSNISLESINSAADIYGNDDEYKSLPHIDTLQEQQKLECHILELLDDHVITLKPEFFSVELDGKKINDFNLILQINELD